MKILNTTLKIVLVLIMISPILGVLGAFSPPTPDLYNTPEAFAFIDALMATGYINWIIAIVFALAAISIISGRTALAAILILPITVCIVGFHYFLDGGLFTMGSLMADVLLVINLYFLWQCRGQYRILFARGV
ncbi:MAG: hypothetical protein Q8L64_05175 [bacterium]|nr:hypothetical protein [bacterium]